MKGAFRRKTYNENSHQSLSTEKQSNKPESLRSALPEKKMTKINGIETEWTQIQRKMGNLPELPEEKEEINEEDYKTEEQKRYEALQNKNAAELEELEDEAKNEDEDRLLEELKRKRLMEMKQKAQRNKFKGVYEISAPEYVNEICKTNEDVWVVVHLYAPGKQECEVFDQICQKLSLKHPYTKFVKIRGNAAIQNFPDRNCPMILLYHKGQMVAQWIGLAVFGGLQHITPDNVEWRLHQYGALETDLVEPPSKYVTDNIAKQKHSVGSFNFVGETYDKKSGIRKSYRDDDDDEEVDEEDEY
jgi:hypothetical protein